MPKNCWKKIHKYRLTVPRQNNSSLSDPLNHNHVTLGDLGCYNGLHLNLQCFNINGDIDEDEEEGM